MQSSFFVFLVKNEFFKVLLHIKWNNNVVQLIKEYLIYYLNVNVAKLGSYLER